MRFCQSKRKRPQRQAVGRFCTYIKTGLFLKQVLVHYQPQDQVRRQLNFQKRSLLAVA
jgi:hypothetical protein